MWSGSRTGRPGGRRTATGTPSRTRSTWRRGSGAAGWAGCGPPGGRVLDPDRLLRISHLIGIFKALNIIYSRKLADAWVRLPNSNRIFAGRAPLAFMMSAGVPAIQTVHRLLDARRGGM